MTGTWSLANPGVKFNIMIGYMYYLILVAGRI